ncbi:sigma-54 interaction domain-containing protein [Trichlorobacter lovleyi]|uniref:Putative sigma54 specific transcriptional regulator n=1 Tax=Trichlorobacter lovleyi (strain ATCC BAA-1151 / DSM 17278 / SZ) TaxID=398767 RepID=B3E4E8_TRIL1|nr:sigma-54 dependent transcriptional regulator [Trichlorobacter lovleyi]ACD94463.1 putative sigma54 specific transcriptional regulator [Trichlorobacter lovleyi SZ]
MHDTPLNQLLDRLIAVAEDLSMGRYGKYNDIFELTKSGQYPPLIARFAESFGMMAVKVEAREYRLEQIIEELRATELQLRTAREQLARENSSLKKNLRRSFPFSSILGTSPQIRELIGKAERIADSRLSVIITGETGTGKELFAKAIHFNSPRSAKPFVAVNCSAIPETIFESEMFGIEKGVATGVEARIGKIQQAQGGTLFLDEVGEMPLQLQAKLLRVLEERTLERVGSRTAIPVDLRIIAATNRDLTKEIAKGSFREDLYYRLNGVTLRIPPLRERKGDIDLIARQFLEKWGRSCGRPPMRIAKEALERLRGYTWPGNVRELDNEIERAVALAYGDTITMTDLSDPLQQQTTLPAAGGKSLLKDSEKQLIEQALKEAKGNKTQAAERLGMSREGLRKKLKRLGME